MHNSSFVDVKVSAPIDRVMIMEDRAQVTRTQNIECESGRNRVVINSVTPLIADRTVRCRIHSESTGAGDGARVLDLHVQRRYVVKQARPEQERELETAFEALKDQYLKVFDQMHADTKERGILLQAAERQKAYISNRLLAGPFDSAWPAEIEDVFSRVSGKVQGILDQRFALREMQLKWKKLEEERVLTLQPVTDYQAEVVVEVHVPEHGRYTLEVEYQVPCALWRPVYTAQLMDGDDGPQIQWRSAGMVWQHTGEDWDDVQLEFSTARPTLNAECPFLNDDIVETREKSEEEKKVVEVSSRDETIARTDQPNVTTSDTPPGLDDGGEVRNYRVGKRVDVPDDGCPHQIEFDRWETRARIQRVSYPEKQPFVFLKSTGKNASRMPLLSGPVSLIRNGGYIGKSEISYVAPGAELELSWGSEDDMVILRDSEETYDEKGFRKKRHYYFHVHNYMANHSDEARKVCLMERIPVSEMEQVEVTLHKDKTTPDYTLNEHGVLEWNRSLEAGQEEYIHLCYEVIMPQSVSWRG